MKNVELKAAIFKGGKSQRKISKETGIPESQLSMAVHGKLNLDPVQREKIAGALGISSKEIFTETK